MIYTYKQCVSVNTPVSVNMRLDEQKAEKLLRSYVTES